MKSKECFNLLLTYKATDFGVEYETRRYCGKNRVYDDEPNAHSEIANIILKESFMEVTVFVRQPNAPEYSKLDGKEFATLPRADEYISADWEGSKKYFQVTAVHHAEDGKTIEVYALQTDPPWVLKKGRAIGFAGR